MVSEISMHEDNIIPKSTIREELVEHYVETDTRTPHTQEVGIQGLGICIQTQAISLYLSMA